MTRFGPYCHNYLEPNCPLKIFNDIYKEMMGWKIENPVLNMAQMFSLPEGNFPNFLHIPERTPKNQTILSSINWRISNHITKIYDQVYGQNNIMNISYKEFTIYYLMWDKYSNGGGNFFLYCSSRIFI